MTAENNKIFTHNKYSTPQDQTIWRRHADMHFAQRGRRVSDFLNEIKTNSLVLDRANVLYPNFGTIGETES